MLHKELNEFDVAYEESLLNFIWNTLIQDLLVMNINTMNYFVTFLS